MRLVSTLLLMGMLGLSNGLKAEEVFSDYYSTLSFREGPYAPHKGVHRLTQVQSKTRNHYRFDYDSRGRIERISFALGEKLRKPNHTANYFWLATVEEYQYKNNQQIVTYRDQNNKRIEVRGGVSTSHYQLDKQGRRVELIFRNKKGEPIDNSWQINSYQWEHQNDGSIIETRRNISGEKINLRPGFEFTHVRLSYDVNGFTSLMQFVDENGKNIATETGFAQDRFTMSRFGELERYDVLNIDDQIVSANMQGIASGLVSFTDYGYESSSSYLNSKGEPTRNDYGWWRSHRQYDQFGNMTTNAFQDLDGQPKSNPITGYATARFKWHEDGINRLWLKYFGENGEPVVHKTRGYHGVIYSYDELQRLIQMTLIDGQGEVTEHLVNGWAIKRYIYKDSNSSAEIKSYSLEEVKSQRLQSLLEGLHQFSKVPGMAVAIAKDGEIVWQGQTGMSNLETRVTVNQQTQFRLASVSKAVTSILVAQQIEKGTINLTTKASELVAVKSDATLAQLLAHTGSIDHYGVLTDQGLDETYQTSTDALTTVIPKLLSREPGEVYQYSTFGYSLIGAMLEAASGKSYNQLVSELAEQLKLTSLVAPLGHERSTNHSRFYQISRKQIELAKLRNFTYSQAGAGLMASAGDLAKLGSLFISGALVSTPHVESILTVQKLNSGELISDKNYQVALGWRLQKALDGQTYYHHAGVTDGARSIILINPDSGISVSILSNASWTADMFQSALAFDKQYSLPPKLAKNDVNLEENHVSNSLLVEYRKCEEISCQWALKNNAKLSDWLKKSGRGNSYRLQGDVNSSALLTPYGLSWLFKKSKNNFLTQIGKRLIEIKYES